MDSSKDKILVLVTEDEEGGAVTWIVNFANVLYQAGYMVAMVVKKKYTNLPYVYEAPIPRRPSKLSRLWRRLLSRRQIDICRVANQEYGVFYQENEMAPTYSPEAIASVISFVPTLIISSLTKEFVNTNTLLALQKKWKAKVLFDAYDMNVMTGACHVVWNCKGYESNCRDCPAIIDIYRRREVVDSFAIRKRNIDAGDMGIMIGSKWSAEKARKSTLFHDKMIFDVGMCTDTDFYTNKNRDIAKRLFDVPEGSKVVFTGSEDLKSRRKGVQYFFRSLEALWNKISPELRERVYIMLIGRSVEEMQVKVRDLPPFHYKLIPYISDNRLLAFAYQAAEVFVCPSQEDAGPQMVADALASGTPVVGFPTGIMYDQSCVINGKTGYVVTFNDVVEMGDAIAKIVSLDDMSFRNMSDTCREIALAELSKYRSLERIKSLKV